MSNQVTLNCEEILNKLKKFSEELLFLGEPITDNRIEKFESEIEFKLPSDYKYILMKHNSLSLSGFEIYGIGEQFRALSLDKVYYFEHNEVGNPMYKELLAFSPDGAGNHYCFDLSKLENNVCPVVFWQHDYLYSDKKDVKICNDNFIDWLQEVVIEETLDDMNYDGSEK